ncbi:S-layer homology domain-containing protein [Paenibacillus sp. GSMTC-2017]|uniref:S-layer homology domain-containing protein n=1 Tax=Paenibacillus sp. GSMTC-2017 TaxID=2794350 RepID=UPI0018D71EDE|nr:S-layer homology domain-containing protein [Paenibacillus sp. GSMTC-2017]MBH5316862.1 S-layer homology domain-containing protein [Paenibacillus sp. GSMTC-2017]
MKKKSLFILTIIAVLVFTLGQSVMAFSDVTNHSNAEKIKSLKEQGIISGLTKDEFRPEDKLTYASGISMIVKGLGLNINHIRFIKAPLASDNHPNLKDDAWYSQAFIVADFYGLDIPKLVKANDPMSKEQFAQHLFKAMSHTGEYSFIEIFIQLNDAADVNPDYQDSIQKLLISKIATLDKNNNFHPTTAITRGEAAGWLYDGIEFVKEHSVVEPEPNSPINDLSLSVESVNADIKKVTVSATLPNPGYGLRITSIDFVNDNAIINVEAILPDPDKMYPQVMTTVKVTTYIDAKLTPVLPEGATNQLSGGSVSSEGIVK